ncbi:hypothetical protein ACROYT_G015454 [Oculina patagonica]
MYADDHQIYANDNDIQKAAQTLRRETEAVTQWYKENLLQANPQKYQILTLDPQPSKRTPEYALKMEFDGHEVKSSEYLKILGVTIDNKLTFSEHISDICKKTSCKPHTTANSEIVKESLVSHKPELPCSQDLTTINLDDLSSLHEEEPPDMCSPVLPEATTTPVGEELISTCIMPSRTKMGQKALLEEN